MTLARGVRVMRAGVYALKRFKDPCSIALLMTFQIEWPTENALFFSSFRPRDNVRQGAAVCAE